jgi:hypothetical protein
LTLRGLLASGWWVLVAAGIVCAATVVLLLLATLGGHHPAAVRPAAPALEPSLIAVDDIVAAGTSAVELPALDDPAVLTADEVAARNRDGRGKLLVPDDRVVGVVVGKEARAYPLRLLRWHEVVNDTLGGRPVTVAYSPLSDSVAVFGRVVDGRERRFTISGLLYQSGHLLVDRGESPGLWCPLEGRAVTGPSAGMRLPLLPCDLAPWADWLAEHPATTVLAPVAELASRYRRDPYHSYFGSDLLRFPVAPLPPARSELRLKDRVVALGPPGAERVLALPRLAAAAGAPSGSYTTSVEGVPLRIDFRLEPGTARIAVLDPGLDAPAVRHAFWFAWYATHPDTVPGP